MPLSAGRKRIAQYTDLYPEQEHSTGKGSCMPRSLMRQPLPRHPESRRSYHSYDEHTISPAVESGSRAARTGGAGSLPERWNRSLLMLRFPESVSENIPSLAKKKMRGCNDPDGARAVLAATFTADHHVCPFAMVRGHSIAHARARRHQNQQLHPREAFKAGTDPGEARR
jgi:hypothetical protein